MGALRFFLAIAIAAGHAGCFWGYCVFPAGHAVQLFYIISGFLIAFILNEKYRPEALWLFYSNRALRIYVPYLFVLAASLAAVLPLTYAFGQYPVYAAPLFQYGPTLDLPTGVFVAFTNFAILGQDVASWLGFDGHLVLAPNPAPPVLPLYSFELLPQAWTMSLELMFYALAPFLVRRKVLLLIAVVVGCYALRMIFFEFGFKHGVWTARFFPFELAHFLMGAVGYRFYAATRTWPIWRAPVCATVVAVALASVVLFQVDDRIGIAHIRLYYSLMALAMPFLFLAGRRSRFDSWLGELSYPIYLIHWPVQWILALMVGAAVPLSVWSVPTTIAASVLFVVLVDRPLDRLRQRRIQGRAAGASVSLQPLPA